MRPPECREEQGHSKRYQCSGAHPLSFGGRDCRLTRVNTQRSKRFGLIGPPNSTSFFESDFNRYVRNATSEQALPGESAARTAGGGSLLFSSLQAENRNENKNARNAAALSGTR